MQEEEGNIGKKISNTIIFGIKTNKKKHIY